MFISSMLYLKHMYGSFGLCILHYDCVNLNAVTKESTKDKIFAIYTNEIAWESHFFINLGSTQLFLVKFSQNFP